LNKRVSKYEQIDEYDEEAYNILKENRFMDALLVTV
jgi:hypothetical protein